MAAPIAVMAARPPPWPLQPPPWLHPAAPTADLSALITAAKAEGALNVIALPHDWCNYGAVIDAFKAKYGLTVNEITPDAGSGDEINAIKANENNKGPQAPDVVDVGFSFGPTGKASNLYMPYKVSTWSSYREFCQGPRWLLVW